MYIYINIIANLTNDHEYDIWSRQLISLPPPARLSQNSQHTPYHPSSSQLSGTELILFWHKLTEKRLPLQTVPSVVVVAAVGAAVVGAAVEPVPGSENKNMHTSLMGWWPLLYITHFVEVVNNYHNKPTSGQYKNFILETCTTLTSSGCWNCDNFLATELTAETNPDWVSVTKSVISSIPLITYCISKGVASTWSKSWWGSGRCCNDDEKSQ